jgi:hypothetical protein
MEMGQLTLGLEFYRCSFVFPLGHHLDRLKFFVVLCHSLGAYADTT